MDPFSAEGELLNIHNAFYQGQYQNVIDFDTSSLSSENRLPAKILKYRAQVALGQPQDVLKEISKGGSGPELEAAKCFAQYFAGDSTEAIKGFESLVQTQSENSSVQILGGIVLQANEKTEEALSLLSKHQGSLEAAALIVQIHLQQNRTDLALREVSAARKWAQDSLLVNIAESWVGIRVGGERYQEAFYVFEEMAQAPSTSAPLSLVGQAIIEIHLGRLEEAEAALEQAIQKDPKDVAAIANYLILDAIAGKVSTERQSSLESIAPNHPLLVDLQEKGNLFDQAATKYAPKVTS